MKCINTHRNWAKLQLMPQSFFLMFSLQRYADGVELHQLHQSQSWKSAKSAVTGAVIFRRCKRNVEALFHTCFTSWLPYLSIQHQIWQRLAGHVSPTEGALCSESVIPGIAWWRQQQQICPATNRSTSIFHSISVTNFIFNSLSVSANYMVK